MGIVAAVFILFPEPFFELFSSDKEVLSIGIGYLTIVAFSYPFRGILMTVSSGFQGAGNTFLAMIMTTGYWIMIIVLAFFFRESYGIIGVWYALLVSAVVGAILTIIVYKTNYWIPKEFK